jgi:hypothetical protein
LESIVHHYEQGASAEEIAMRFPALRLSDVHSSLSYYLSHQEHVQSYRARQTERAESVQRQIENDPLQKRGMAQLCLRLQKRAN